MRFYRRDLVLLAASVLFTLAAAMYMGPYALGVGAALFFGMKMIAVRRQQEIERQVGEGLCAECGQRVVGGMCPSCGGDVADGGAGPGRGSGSSGASGASGASGGGGAADTGPGPPGGASGVSEQADPQLKKH